MLLSYMLCTNNKKQGDIVICLQGDEMFYQSKEDIRFADMLFYELAAWGYIGLDFQNGIIWNMVTNRQMGHVNNTGYVAVAWKYHGKVIHSLAHRVLWTANNTFIPDGMQINHMNGIKTDNRSINLELVTPSENVRHAFVTGLVDLNKLSNSLKKFNSSNISPCASFTEEQIIAIRKRHLTGGKANTIKAIARDYGISHSSISDICNHKSYRCIK